MYLPKDAEKSRVDPKQRIDYLLSESEKAIREGNRQRAYELSLQATKTVPESIEAWFLRASLAPSLEERLFCVNCMNELCPDCQDRHQVAFAAVKEQLERDPFLAYLEETEALYRVISKNNQVLVIPKKRAAGDTGLPERPSPLKPAYRLLTLAILGLLSAGIATLVFAPLAALAALQAGPSLRTRSEQVSSTVILLLAGLLFLVGAFFGVLFALHWVG